MKLGSSYKWSNLWCNTTGAHGYPPRDIDRRWSLSLPLQRELQPFQVNEFEPLEDYVRNCFRTYRELKVKVLTHLQSKSLERAELANRFRRAKGIEVGDRVLIRDQRQRRAGRSKGLVTAREKVLLESQFAHKNLKRTATAGGGDGFVRLWLTTLIARHLSAAP